MVGSYFRKSVKSFRCLDFPFCYLLIYHLHFPTSSYILQLIEILFLFNCFPQWNLAWNLNCSQNSSWNFGHCRRYFGSFACLFRNSSFDFEFNDFVHFLRKFQLSLFFNCYSRLHSSFFDFLAPQIIRSCYLFNSSIYQYQVWLYSILKTLFLFQHRNLFLSFVFPF